MSTERKEPIISGIRPDQDEIARHQQRQKARPSSTPQDSVVETRPAPAPRPVVVRSKLAPFALLLALTGLGLAGFSYWQFMQVQQSLVLAEGRIAELEGKLEMSDDESNASMTAMQAKLKWADAEIRKLWGVAYDTNRKSIAANKEAIDALAKTAGGIDGKIKNALTNTSAEIKLINDLIEAQQGAMVDIERKSGEQLAQMREYTDRISQLQKTEEELKRRVSSNEEAIRAIDAFRRTVNQQLLQMQGNKTP